MIILLIVMIIIGTKTTFFWSQGCIVEHKCSTNCRDYKSRSGKLCQIRSYKILDCGKRGKLGYRENTSHSIVENQQIQPKYGVEDGIEPSPHRWNASPLSTAPNCALERHPSGHEDYGQIHLQTKSINPLTILSYPTYTSVLLRAIEWWYHDPNVSTPVLKLMAELVQNRSQRLHFDVSSPNGILLFRVTSEMIVAYGKRCCVLCLFTLTKPLSVVFVGEQIVFRWQRSFISAFS